MVDQACITLFKQTCLSTARDIFEVLVFSRKVFKAENFISRILPAFLEHSGGGNLDKSPPFVDLGCWATTTKATLRCCV